jgi:quinol monooxygenase YgiN
VIFRYTRFAVETDDRAGFDKWMLGLVSETRLEEGCLIYDYAVEPDRPTHGTILSVWSGPDVMAAHYVTPVHVEMTALGSAKWGMGELESYAWDEAAGFRTGERAGVDELEGDQAKAALLAKVRRYQSDAALGKATPGGRSELGRKCDSETSPSNDRLTND